MHSHTYHRSTSVDEFRIPDFRFRRTLYTWPKVLPESNLFTPPVGVELVFLGIATANCSACTEVYVERTWAASSGRWCAPTSGPYAFLASQTEDAAMFSWNQSLALPQRAFLAVPRVAARLADSVFSRAMLSSGVAGGLYELLYQTVEVEIR